MDEQLALQWHTFSHCTLHVRKLSYILRNQICKGGLFLLNLKPNCLESASQRYVDVKEEMDEVTHARMHSVRHSY